MNTLSKYQYLLLRFKIKFRYYWICSTKNYKWSLMFILSRFQIFRSIATYISKPYSLDKYQENPSLFESLNVKDVVESLRANGYYLGIKLPQNIVKEIFSFTQSEKCFANQDQQIFFNLSEKEDAQAKYKKTFVISDYLYPETCSAISKIENDPKLVEIAANYLKSKPISTNTRLWWSFAGDVALNERLNFAQELFHYDPLDYSSLKFFFYITDVDLSSGPHVCVRGSHKKKKLSHQLTLFIGRSDQEIINYYQFENIVTICGEAGFGFAEDPYCFHKGTPPMQRDRLMLQVEFCRNDYRLNEIESV